MLPVRPEAYLSDARRQMEPALTLLVNAGLPAEPVGEVEIVVRCDDGGDLVFARAEQLIMEIGDPFVPIKHEGVIYIRPPVG